MTQKVEYSSNNSGGGWWLADEDWKALEKAGWKVNWKRDEKNSWEEKPSERWLGALATSAERDGLSLKDAVAEWEEITGKSSTDAGCPCCGQPHNFSYYEDGEWKDSGPHTSYDCEW